jgi:hypothetical protein
MEKKIMIKMNNIQINHRSASLAAAMLVLILLFSACTAGNATQVPVSTTLPAPQSTVIPGTGGGLVVKENAPFAVAAKKALAEKLQVSLDQVTFVSAESTEWPDKCLGVIVMGQMCAQGVTPGYLVKLKVNDVVHEVHTDELGESVRIKE